MNMRRLPDAELEVMKALWELGPDTPRSELGAALKSFHWAPNTINTYLARLAEKDFVSVRREQKTNLYSPLVDRETYLAFESRNAVERLYGSPRNFLAAFAREGLRREELRELRDLLDRLEGDPLA